MDHAKFSLNLLFWHIYEFDFVLKLRDHSFQILFRFVVDNYLFPQMADFGLMVFILLRVIFPLILFLNSEPHVVPFELLLLTLRQLFLSLKDLNQTLQLLNRNLTVLAFFAIRP